MQQRDILKDEIEKISKVLARLAAKLLGIEDDIQFNTIRQQTASTLKDELDFDLDELLSLNDVRYMAALQQLQLGTTYLERLIEILHALGQKSNTSIDKLNYHKKALATLNFLEHSTQSTGFVQLQLRGDLEREIEHLE